MLSLVALAATLSAPVPPMQPAWASWYGPGLYGRQTGCGGRLTPRTRGVAHKTLPCGTKLRLCYRRCTTTRVVDRGPYVGGRTFDLTNPVRVAVGMPKGVRRLRWRRVTRTTGKGPSS